MRGRRQAQTTMLAFVDLEERVPRNHPLRVVYQFADRALRELSPVVWRARLKSFRRGPIAEEEPARLSIYDIDGNLLLRWGGADAAQPVTLLRHTASGSTIEVTSTWPR